MPKQLDLFGLVDEDNITFYIVYLDEENRLKKTEPLNATKSNIFTALSDWCKEHKSYRFMYYKPDREVL
jgi:hypothetical protein